MLPIAKLEAELVLTDAELRKHVFTDAVSPDPSPPHDEATSDSATPR